MPPHNLFESDCDANESVPSMGRFLSSLLSSSLNTLTPMCNDSAGPRVYSPTYPMNDPPTYPMNDPPSSSSANTSPSSKTTRKQTSPGNSCDPRRPPLNPVVNNKVYKKSDSFRERKKLGLSIDVPAPPSDPHSPRGVDEGHHHNPPSPISSPRNIELRRKSLSERHFFRPVSEDEESTVMSFGNNHQ